MLMRAAGMIAGMVLGTAAAMADQRDVLLEVTGRIAEGRVALGRDALEAMPPVVIETSTVVTDGIHSFAGFLMRDLLETLGAEGEQITAIAINDYAVDIPIADFYDYDVIVAYSMDAKMLTRDDKGPLWIIYPRDDHAALQDIRYDYRWVWQLHKLDVQ